MAGDPPVTALAKGGARKGIVVRGEARPDEKSSRAKPQARAAGDPADAVEGDARRVGLYPGTFDPITNGHLDIIARAAKLVDRLVIGVAVNRDKGPLFTLEERVSMVEEECARLMAKRGGDCIIEVRPFNTLLIKFAEEVQAHVIVRGLRAVSDFEYEFQMVGMNQKLNPGVETVFLMADPTHQAIASRLVKEISRLGGDVRQFVPAAVQRRLQAKFGDAK